MNTFATLFNIGTVFLVWTIFAVLFLALLSSKRLSSMPLWYRFGGIQALYFALPLGLLSLCWGSWSIWSPVVERGFTNWLVTQKQYAATWTTPVTSEHTSQLSPISSLIPNLLGVYATQFALMLAVSWLLFQFIRFGRLFWHLRQFKRQLIALEDQTLPDTLHDTLHETLHDTLPHFCQQLRLSPSRIRLCTTSAPIPPLTFGWRKPVIVLPMSLLSMPREAIEQALLHELLHIRRHDFAWVMLEHTLHVVFDFHPLFRRLHAQISLYREQMCDVGVLSIGKFNATSYAQLLFHFSTLKSASKQVHSMTALCMSSPYSDLKIRLSGLKHGRRYNWHQKSRQSQWFAFACVLLLTLPLKATHLQTYHPPSIFAQYARQVEGCTFSLQNGAYSLRFDKQILQDHVPFSTQAAHCDIRFQIAGQGELLLSAQPFAGSAVAGYVKGNTLYVNHKGFELRLENDATLFGKGDYAPIYGHYLSHCYFATAQMPLPCPSPTTPNMFHVGTFSDDLLTLAAQYPSAP